MGGIEIPGVTDDASTTNPPATSEAAMAASTKADLDGDGIISFPEYIKFCVGSADDLQDLQIEALRAAFMEMCNGQPTEGCGGDGATHDQFAAAFDRGDI